MKMNQTSARLSSERSVWDFGERTLNGIVVLRAHPTSAGRRNPEKNKFPLVINPIDTPYSIMVSVHFQLDL